MNDTNPVSGGGSATDGSANAAPTPPAEGVNPPVQGTTPVPVSADDDFFVIPAHPNTQFDENYFLELLKGSLSLSLEEKKRVLAAIPRLGMKEINELIKIFEQEKTEFAKLEKEFSDDVQKLKQQRTQEVASAKTLEETKVAESAKKDEEADKINALREQLGG